MGDGLPSRQSVELARLARALRAAVIEHYAERGEPLDDPRGLRTLDTNSTLAPERAQLLVDLLAKRGTVSLEGLDVIDIGCGFGSLGLCLAAYGARVIGIDQYPERLEVAAGVAARLSLPAEFREGRMEALVLPDQSVDIAVMNNSFCYVTEREDRRRSLGHALRVLRPGGWLVIRDPARGSPIDPFSGLPVIHQLPLGIVARLPQKLVRQRSSVRLHSRPAQKRELRSAGFVSVKSHRIGSRRFKPNRYQHFTARRPPLDQLRP